jgi:hypothetical protein
MELTATKQPVAHMFLVDFQFFKECCEAKNMYALEKVAEAVSIERSQLFSKLLTTQNGIYAKLESEIRNLDSVLKQIREKQIAFNLGKQKEAFSTEELIGAIQSRIRLDELSALWKFIPEKERSAQSGIIYAY